MKCRTAILLVVVLLVPATSAMATETEDPGFWKSLLIGHDRNGDGTLTGSERGAIPAGIEWVQAKLLETAKPIIDTLITAIPGVDEADLEPMYDYIEVGNYWFPFDVLLTLITLYWLTWCIAFIVGKFIFKAIPAVG
jgi:hypothetical protein